MRLFQKHIGKSLGAHPFQPVLIVITVSLCVCICLCALGLQRLFFERAEQIENQNTALGDIVVTLGGDSEERVLFADDARRLLGDSATVLGDYSLTAFMTNGGNSLVRVHAADLEEADRYFLFDIREYGRFTNENLDSSVIISQSFARDRGLSLYDTITLDILGQTATYTVQAIANDEVYFNNCDILCPISSAVALLAERSPLIANLEEDFLPSNRLLIRVSPGYEAQQVFEDLSSSPTFGDDYTEISGATAYKDLSIRSKTLVLAAIALVMTLLCAMVIVSAHRFLTQSREVEYALFELSGASAGQVAGLMLGEVFIYALVGGLIGGGLSPFAFDLAASLFSWYRGGEGLTVFDFLAGFLVAFVLMFTCTLISVYKKSRKQLCEIISPSGYADTVERPTCRVSLLVASLLVLATASTAIIPIEFMYIPAAAMLTLSTILIYTLFPVIFFGISSVLEKIAPAKTPVFLLSQKNIKNNGSPKNIGRLMAVLLTLLVTIALCGEALRSQVDIFGNMITGDILVVGLPTDLKEELEADGRIDGLADFSYYMSTELNGQYSVMTIGIDGEPHQCLSGDLLPAAVPDKGKVALSKGLALLCDVEVGDHISLSQGGNNYEFEVAEVTDTVANLVYTNTASFKNTAEVTILSLADASRHSEMVAHLESQGVMVVDETVFDLSGLDTLDGFLALIRVAFLSAIVVCSIGLFNMLAQQAKMRRSERDLLALSGMTRRQIVGVQILELVSVLVISALFAGLLGQGLFRIIDLGAHSFGITFL